MSIPAMARHLLTFIISRAKGSLKPPSVVISFLFYICIASRDTVYRLVSPVDVMCRYEQKCGLVDNTPSPSFMSQLPPSSSLIKYQQCFKDQPSWHAWRQGSYKPPSKIHWNLNYLSYPSTNLLIYFKVGSLNAELNSNKFVQNK